MVVDERVMIRVSRDLDLVLEYRHADVGDPNRENRRRSEMTRVTLHQSALAGTKHHNS
jgi:hypothetical protein